jgi:lipoprotein-releasing system ATP-binding protein
MSEISINPSSLANSESESAEIILQASNLSKIYHEAGNDIVVFKDLSFQVKKGDMIAICGASGSGKSTLLHMLGGLDKPTSGNVKLLQKDVWGLAEAERCQLRNRHLGFVYQFHHLLPEFNALENVMMPLQIGGFKRNEAKEKATDFLHRVKLSHRLLHRVGELSGGERQRVAIARALVTEPDCVLADEPTGNLDHAIASDIFALMLSLNQTLKTSFVMVTHNNELAAQMDQQWDLIDGQLRSHSEINC